MRKTDLKTIAVNYCTDVALSPDGMINEKAFIQPILLRWYRQCRRKMPWRGDNTVILPSAYGTWVSEVMLQQTRVETVIDYWNRWMEVFPDVKTLASASPDEVNKLWAGLGYYRRAQMLLKGALKVVEDFNGVLPDTTQELLKIPGIGPYTAGAIASIAYDKAEPLVDGNVMRVFSRLFAIKLEVGGGAMEKLCWKLATELVPVESPGDFNQALMELGATVCKPTSPDCGKCPLNSVCHAKLLVDEAKLYDAAANNKPGNSTAAGMLKLFAKKRKLSEKEDDAAPGALEIEDLVGPVCSLSREELGFDMALLPRDVTEFPRKVSKKKAKELTYSVCVLRTKSLSYGAEELESSEGTFRYLFVRRPASGLLANQWEFPSIHMPLSGEEMALNVDEIEETSGIDTEAGSPVPTAVDLWAPFPVYFAERLKMQWATSADDPAGHSCGDEKKDVKTESAPLSLDTMLVETAVHDAFEPIVHVFSHQRHTMHITLRDVQVVQRTEKLVGESPALASGVLCKWMTAKEIVEAGITTGCKKILTQVVKEKTVSSSSGKSSKAIKASSENPSKKTTNKTKQGTTQSALKTAAGKCDTKLGKPFVRGSVTAMERNDELIVEITDTDEEDMHVTVKNTPKNAFDLMKRANSATKTITTKKGAKK